MSKPTNKPIPTPVKPPSPPQWKRARLAIRTCWACDTRCNAPWVSPTTGMCLCDACYTRNHAPKRGTPRARRGVRAWRR